jgi:hypothetical protein
LFEIVETVSTTSRFAGIKTKVLTNIPLLLILPMNFRDAVKTGADPGKYFMDVSRVHLDSPPDFDYASGARTFSDAHLLMTWIDLNDPGLTWKMNHKTSR